MTDGTCHHWSVSYSLETLATDLIVFNVTKENFRVREAIVNPNTWPVPASPAELSDPTLLTPRSDFINSGMLVDLLW